ncbi:MarR family winged helix-turn-helix transcriptional regulator [Nonomuraea sp. NEAU-A123]|uniref:MarR family winged helix-turn-helix transcriptional regulator n=1 Tax=Nonomuraea sp. NEAU-A123 TaxID=2839649 RepID=UPI001BE48EE5|nr:MarR family transcriptional regulator [Nonomuraea sp. NEAU-A123]MBT2230969.1 MarR family transcriptional regulator [Nonomuraea sp. NEAU-A123]
MTTTTGLGFAAALVRMSHLVQREFADVSRQHDLTPQQTQLLCMLIGGPVGMTELSKLLHLEKSSLTGLVDRVERRGLVARVADPRDRRACQIELTPQGTQLANDSHGEITRRLDAVAEVLSQDDRDRLPVVVAQLLTQRDL